MRALVVVVALAGGCGFAPHTTPGLVDASVIDASDAIVIPPIDAIDGSALVDTDHDGIFDDTDNCIAVANPDQHDEDGDHVGDACDPCPYVANAISDTDGDGIPDACDPHPQNGGDTLVTFAPFTGTALPAGWITASVSYTISGDALNIDATASTQVFRYDSGFHRHAIDVIVELPQTAGGVSFFTALTDLKDDVAQYFGCGVRIDAPTYREFFTFDGGTYTDIATDPMPGVDPVVFPATYRFISTMDANQTCVIPGPVDRHKMQSNVTDNNRKNVGVRIGGVAVKIRSIAVYTF